MPEYIIYKKPHSTGPGGRYDFSELPQKHGSIITVSSMDKPSDEEAIIEAISLVYGIDQFKNGKYKPKDLLAKVEAYTRHFQIKEGQSTLEKTGELPTVKPLMNVVSAAAAQDAEPQTATNPSTSQQAQKKAEAPKPEEPDKPGQVRYRFSPVREVPFALIRVKPELFQGRETAFAEETVAKIMREGFDKSQEPITLFEDAEGDYVVISGHSRYEAARRLQDSDPALSSLPARFFQGNLSEAMDYALLESNRSGTPESLLADIRAYKRAHEQGYNQEYLKGLFKPTSRLLLLERLSHLSERGSFLRFLSDPAADQFPYLPRNAGWVGELRKRFPLLSDAQEEELFRYLYEVSDKGKARQKLTLSKEAFFDLIEKRVSHIAYSPDAPLNLAQHTGHNPATDPAREALRELDREMQQLIKERNQKDVLIARAWEEGKARLIAPFEKRQKEINRILQRLHAQKTRQEDAIRQADRQSLDLFSNPLLPDPQSLPPVVPPVEPATEVNEEQVITPLPENELLDLLSVGNWFKQHPEKVFGKALETTNAWGEQVIHIRGSLEDLLKVWPHPAAKVPAEVLEQLAATSVLEQSTSLFTAEQRSSVDAVIQESLDRQVQREQRHMRGLDDQCPEGMFCFDDILRQYNPGISREAIQAWVWYQRRQGYYRDEASILDPANGWHQFIIQEDEEMEHIRQWVETGLLCYAGEERYIPAVLFFAENIYERQAQLLAHRAAIHNRYGKDYYQSLWTQLEAVKPETLRLDADTEARALFLEISSRFVQDWQIGQLADGTQFRGVETEQGRYLDKLVSLPEAFKIWLRSLPADTFKKSTALYIISHYVNEEGVSRQFDKEEQARIRQNARNEGATFFRQFLATGLAPTDQRKIEYAWNRQYNGYVEIDYHQVPVGFSCSSTFKNAPLYLRRAQREGLGFFAVHGIGCLAYGVGVGKTLTGILALAQALEMGQCRRPLIVSPKGPYANWKQETQGRLEGSELKETGALPQYPLLDLFNLSKTYREQLPGEEGQYERIPAGTISLMTYEGFRQLGFSEALIEELAADFETVLEQGSSTERHTAQFQERMLELVGRGLRGTFIDISQLGFDFIIIDEAHNMKKLFTRVKGEVTTTGGRGKHPYQIERIGEPSARALHAFMINQYIMRQSGFRNVLLLSATPVTNSPIDIFSFLTLVAWQPLKAAGIANLKTFFDLYAMPRMQLIINRNLEAQRKTVIVGFNNLKALQQLVFRFIHYKSEESAGTHRPTRLILPLNQWPAAIDVVEQSLPAQVSTTLPMQAEQARYARLVQRYAAGKIGLYQLIESARNNPDVVLSEAESKRVAKLAQLEAGKEEGTTVRILLSMHFASALALSPYLFPYHSLGRPTPKAFVQNSPPVAYAMGCIASVKRYCAEQQLPMPGQLIYANAALPFFPLMEAYLIEELGFATEEVASISGKTSQKQRELIQRQFNEGIVKVLIGTSTIREGINLQQHATDLYDLLVDWNPTDFQQLSGRIWRPGNPYAFVRIVLPLVENSFSIFRFQKLQEKTARIRELWKRKGSSNALQIDDFDTAAIKRSLVSDPRLLAELQLLEGKENLKDELSSLRARQRVLAELAKARRLFEQHLPRIRAVADAYRPPKQKEPRKVETLLSIYKRWLDDPGQTHGHAEEEEYQTFRKAHTQLQKGERFVLKPLGLTVDFEAAEVLGKLKAELQAKEEQLQVENSEEAIQLLAKQIEQERAQSNAEQASLAARVAEFAQLNPLVLESKNQAVMAQPEEVEDDALSLLHESQEKISQVMQDIAFLEAMANDLKTITQDL